jgi:hypothetical protein
MDDNELDNINITAHQLMMLSAPQPQLSQSVIYQCISPIVGLTLSDIEQLQLQTQSSSQYITQCHNQLQIEDKEHSKSNINDNAS